MATSNAARDVRLTLGVDVTGEEGIQRLAADVRTLAKEGGDAAPELRRIADDIDRLGQQAAAVTTLKTLAAEVRALGESQASAAGTAEKLKAELIEQRNVVSAAADAQRRARAELDAAELTRDRAVQSLKAYAEVSKAARLTDGDYVATLREMTDERSKSVVALREAQQALRSASAEAGRAEAAERKLADQYGRADAEARAATAAVRQRSQAQEQAVAAALALGVATEDLAASDARLLAESQRLAGTAAQVADAQRAQAAAVAAGADAMRKLEDASNRADAQQRELVASLRAAEAAATEYAAATERAAAAGADDVRAAQERQRAATALLDAERALSAEQRQLAALRNANRAGLVAEAQAYVQSAAAAREAQQAIAATATAAKQAGQQIEQSFGVLGIRSINAIEAEIRETEQALTRLEVRARAGAVGIDEIQRAAGAAEVKLSRLRAEIQQVQAAPTQFEALASSINSIITRFAGLGAAVATVGVAVRPVIDATLALEAMRRTLTTVTGSAQQAAEQIEFVRTVASRSGQAFDAVGQAYSKFVASALQTGLSLKDTQAVFESVSLAAGNLGLSTEQSGRALEALSQIASKGVVSMEELRGQLGDALPGVLPLLAKELGLTTAELNKVVESGQLLAGDAIPAIGRALQKLGPEQGAQVQGLSAEWNRFISVIKEAGVAIVEGPLGQAAGVVLQGAAVAIGALAATAVAASEGFKILGVSVLATLDALRGNRSWEDAGKAISDFSQQSAERVAQLTSRIDRMVGASGEAATAAGTLAGALTQTTAASVRAAGGTEQQATSMAKLALVQGKAIADAELQTQVTEKLAQAAEQEAKAQKVIIELLDDEGEARVRQAESSEKVAVARERVAAAAAAEVASLQSGKQAILDVVGANEKLLLDNKKLLDQYDDKIKKADADREKSQALADTARNQADAARIAAKAYGDQSASADDLRKKVEEAGRTLEAVTKLQREGWLATKDVIKAERDLLEAKQLLTDALNDQDKATKRTIDSLKAAADVTKAEIALEITKLEIKKQNLIADGRTAEAARLDLEIKRLQLSSTKAGTEAKLAEARATQELILKQFAEAEARGVLTPALRQELNTRYEQQRAIILETEASKLNEEQQRKNIDAAVAGTGARRENRDAVESHTGSVGTNTGAVGSNTGALRDNERAKRDNAAATGALAIEQEKYAAALEKARKQEGITGKVDGSTVGRGAAGIQGPKDGSVFTDAGRQARNESFKNTPFVSGSTGGGSYSTGQAVNKPPGNWDYVIQGFDVPGVDASGNRLPGGWKVIRGPSGVTGAGFAGQASLGAGAAFDIANPFGNSVTPSGAGTALTASTAPGTGRELVSTDTDTPGTVGTISNVPILGKYEVAFTANGRTNTVFTDTAEQAQAFIDNLQAAFRSANGGG